MLFGNTSPGPFALFPQPIRRNYDSVGSIWDGSIYCSPSKFTPETKLSEINAFDGTVRRGDRIIGRTLLDGSIQLGSENLRPNLLGDGYQIRR